MTDLLNEMINVIVQSFNIKVVKVIELMSRNKNCRNKIICFNNFDDIFVHYLIILTYNN